MIFWILCGIAVVAIIATYAIQLHRWPTLGVRTAAGYALAALGWSVAALLVYTFTFGYGVTKMAMGGSSMFTYEVTGTDVYALRSLDLGDPSYSGDFFLASGTVDQVRSFTYVKEYLDGELRIETIPMESIRLYEDTVPELAHIEVTHFTTDDVSFWFPGGPVKAPDSTTFHIPPGTIAQNFTIQP